MGQIAAFLPEIITAAGYAGSGALSSAFAPSPFQPRTAYTGSNSAESTLGGAGDALKKVFAALTNKASQPVSLPDATVQPLPSMSGGDLPFSIGNFSDPGSLRVPASLSGLDFGSPNPSSPPGIPQPQINNSSIPATPGTSVAAVDQRAAVSPMSGPVRQKFAASNNPSAMTSDVPTDPRLAAITLLQHAAMAA